MSHCHYILLTAPQSHRFSGRGLFILESGTFRDVGDPIRTGELLSCSKCIEGEQP